MLNKRKWMAIAMMIVLVTGLLFSYQFLIKNAHHHCSGEDCPICSEMAQAVQFISNIKFVPMLSFFMAVLFILTLSNVILKTQSLRNDTLISLKVELLN